MKSPLSKEAVDLLYDNGYRINLSSSKITIKRPYNYIGAFIILFIFSMLALPLFDYSYWLGAMIFALLVVSIFLHRNLISKASSITINLENGKITIDSKNGKRWFTTWYIRNLFIKSNFKSEYTSSFKNTSQEFLVVVGVQLKSGESIDFLYLLSDYQEPTDTMNEVHHFLESALSKKKET